MAEPTLETRALGKRFGAIAALEDVTLALRGPRLVVILGPDGAGKTTLLDLAEGLAEPTSGDRKSTRLNSSH